MSRNFMSVELPRNMNLPQLPARLDEAHLRTYLSALHQALLAWNLKVAQLFAVLNMDRVLIGTESERPLASGARLAYITTDTLKLYVDGGTTWNEVST